MPVVERSEILHRQDCRRESIFRIFIRRCRRFPQDLKEGFLTAHCTRIPHVAQASCLLFSLAAQASSL